MREPAGSERERLEKEFLPEAEEIFESLAGGLVKLEAAVAGGRPPAPILNAIFRGAHSLKGLSALQGLPGIAGVAHDLEDCLDNLRMARRRLDGPALDLLHEAIDVLRDLVRAAAEGREVPDPSGLRGRLRASGQDGAAGAAPAAAAPDAAVDASIRRALSEYEEHRLDETLRSGTPLFRLRLRFLPQDFDTRLREVLGRLEGPCEVIATIPAMGDAGDDAMCFLLLVASPAGERRLGEALHGTGAVVERIAARAAEGGTAGAPGHEEPDDLRGLSDSVRVPIERLDDLLGRVADLSIGLAGIDEAARGVREAHAGPRAHGELARRVRALAPKLEALQRSAIEARLVPIEQVFLRVGRMVARAARASGREVDLHTFGGDTEIDKVTMDALASPLVHLLRNAIDHGIEPPAERERAGKARRGRLVLSAFPRGGLAVIDVIDDGRGIDPERVAAAARASGRIDPGRSVSAAEALDLIFVPGLSTAENVSETSGRGVGLDVVRRGVRRLKGSIEVRSAPGQGTTFTLTVPITLALVPALLVKAGGQRFAIPLAAVRESLRIDPARLRSRDGVETYDHPSGAMPLLRPGLRCGGSAYAVIAGPADGPVAIAVDALLGQREVVVQPLSRRLRDLPGMTGATDLGDAAAVLVLDPDGLAAVSGGRHGFA